tara:strand:- start:124 stop:855 length:732 start_codon:yes stop_codon:yes gene_type:complete
MWGMAAIKKGTAMKDKKKRAGGGSPPVVDEVRVATTTGTGNFVDAVKIGFWDYQTHSYAYSGGIKDGSTSVLSTGGAVNTGLPNPATSTIQTQSFAVSDYVAAYNNNFADVPIIIGGAIRTTLSGSNTNTNKEEWGSFQIVSQSLSNSVIVQTSQVDDTLVYPAPDRTIMNTGNTNPPYGIYDLTTGNRGVDMLQFRNGKTGVAANDSPAAGDTVTIRFAIKNAYNPGAVGLSRAHDIVINFV